jgi:hypothetical protein
MRADIRGTLQALADRLKAPDIGVEAGIDPEALNAPCVWITPRQIHDYTLDGGGTLIAWCYLIAPNTDTPNAMSLLDDTLAGLLAVAPVAESDSIIDLAAAVVLPANPTTPLPAYRVAVDLDL